MGMETIFPLWSGAVNSQTEPDDMFTWCSHSVSK